jgi:ABC-type glycerol-3-phosphate transport system substrate-binding protein
MDEFLKVIDILKANGVTPITFIPAAGWTLGDITRQLANNYALSMGLSANNHNEMVKIEDPCAQDKPLGKAVTLMYSLAKKGYTGADPMSLSWDACKVELAKGNIAMAYFGSWFPPQVEENGAKPGEIGLMPFPITNAQGRIMATGDFDWNYVVSKTSKNKVAAKAFVDFLFSNNDAYAIWMNNFGKTSVRKSIKDTASFLGDYYAHKPVINVVSPDDPLYAKVRDTVQFGDQQIGAAAVAAMNDEEFNTAMAEFNTKWAIALKSIKK